MEKALTSGHLIQNFSELVGLQCSIVKSICGGSKMTPGISSYRVDYINLFWKVRFF